MRNLFIPFLGFGSVYNADFFSLPEEIRAGIEKKKDEIHSGEDMERCLNVSPGSATVMGLLFDPEHKVQLLIDEEVLQEEYFGCHPCVNTSSIRFRTEDMLQKVLKALDHDYITVTLSDGREEG